MPGIEVVPADGAHILLSGSGSSLKSQQILCTTDEIVRGDRVGRGAGPRGGPVRDDIAVTVPR
ncbi:hypothetical protein [Nocardia sp. NBC_01388]|uniref:hypothetical protein n=1 Tax=Nocardia sp. NBC_01388 TaxID=2903596 RepID=UPI00324B539D